MYNLCSDQDVVVAPDPAPDRYRHIHFLSGPDSAPPAPSCLRPVVSRTGVSTLCARPAEAESLEPEAKRFLESLLARAGVELACYRGAPLARRLQACLRSLRARSLSEAWERLVREPDQVAQAASTLLIGVTQFFREPAVFSYLDKAVLPKLSASGTGLRVWSAGCADGAELYSVAMLLAGHELLDGSTLLGTDCRLDAIRHAQRGWFDSTQLQSLDEGRRQTYFVPHQRGWQICGALRQAALWQQGDALAGPPAGQPSWDLILCRNVAIYLEPTAAARLWTVLVGSLRIGGILVVGKAERPQQQLSLLRSAPCVFEKRG